MKNEQLWMPCYVQEYSLKAQKWQHSRKNFRKSWLMVAVPLP